MVTNILLKVEHPYIEKVDGVCGGKAKIKNTRIKVSQIAVEHIDMKMDIDEIIKSQPHLHYWEIYDALSYYYANQVEIDEELVNEMTFVKKIMSNNLSKLEGSIASNVY